MPSWVYRLIIWGCGVITRCLEWLRRRMDKSDPKPPDVVIDEKDLTHNQLVAIYTKYRKDNAVPDGMTSQNFYKAYVAYTFEMAYAGRATLKDAQEAANQAGIVTQYNKDGTIEYFTLDEFRQRNLTFDQLADKGSELLRDRQDLAIAQANEILRKHK